MATQATQKITALKRSNGLAANDPLMMTMAAMPTEQQITSTLVALRMARAGCQLLAPSLDMSHLDHIEQVLQSLSPATTTPLAPVASAPTPLFPQAEVQEAEAMAMEDRRAKYPRFQITNQRQAAALRKQVTTTSYDPSDLQLTVLYFIKYGKPGQHGVVDAVAGAGKTSTLIAGAKLIQGTALFCAFNAKTAATLQERLAGTSMTASTIHSLGNRTVRKFLGAGVQVQEDKYYRLINGAPGQQGTVQYAFPRYAQPEKDTVRAAAKVIKDLSRYARLTLTDPTDTAAMDLLVAQFSIDLDPEIAPSIYRAVSYTLERGEEQARRAKIIDFDDMIWLPSRWNLTPEQVDWLMVDECQDLNKAQRALVLKVVKPGTGRALFVGDPNQSIYGFAGADVESFWNILDDTHGYLLDLSICYRCPTSVISLAQTLVPQITAAPTAKAGAVRTIKEQDLNEQVRYGDMMLCRVTAPLVSQCMSLIAAGKPAKVIGSDIGKAMGEVIKAVMAMPGATWMDFGKYLEQYELLLTAKLEQRENMESKIEALHDKCAAVNICWQQYHASTPEELMARINNLFTDDQKPPIKLSTVHRAKGAENRRVFILKPSKLPLAWQGQQEWEKQQERNIQYVAYTRALEELILVEEDK